MKICIGSDHRGYACKVLMMQALPGYTWLDEGSHDDQRTDYPIYAYKVCKKILDAQASFGVLICGSGVGMSIAANRFKGIYAALCWNEAVACVARQDDGTNVLVLPSDFVSNEQAVAIFKAWIGAQFKSGRYQERLDQIDNF